MERKNIAAAIAAGIFLFMSPAGHADAAPDGSKPILGTSAAQWEQDLKSIGGEYVFSDTFVQEIMESQKRLESKHGSEHFEKLGSKVESAKEKRRKNSLLHAHPQKTRSKFVLDLNLDKNEYSSLIRYIPILGNYYGEHHIAQMLPYIAFCIRYDVDRSIIDYYVHEFLQRETPPDIACERFYRLAEGNM